MRTKALENHHSSSFWMSTSRLALPALGLLLALISLSSFPQTAYAAYSASVSRTSSGTVRLAESGGSSIKPSSTGTLGTGSDTVTVTSNCTAGYNLYVSGISGGSTNLNRSGASSSELNDASNYIASTTTNTGSESTLTKDTWGVGKDGKTFSKLPAYSSDTSTLTALYSGVGDANNTAKNYTIYYGANVSTAKTPGTYTGDVLYTVVMNSSCQKWTLNFNGNSATTNNLTSQELAFDSTINLADISSSSMISRTGYTLTGWTDQLGNSYGTSGIVDVNPGDAASVTLTAQWQINSHNVSITRGTNVSTVTATDGTTTKTNTTLTADYNKTITISATAFSTGYHFSGWTVNSGGVTLYSNSTTTTQSTTSTPAYFKMPDTDVTITANATANTYTFSYNANGGSGSPATSSNTGAYGGNVTTSNTGSMSKTGYHLLGWSTSSTATSAICNVNTSCSVSTLASNAGKTGPSYHNSTITLYAVWEANSFTITYSTNGGTGSASKTSETAKYGTNVTMPTKNTLAKSGYEFLGWSLSSTATSATWSTSASVAPTSLKSNVSTTNGGSVTVYAVWQSSVSDCSDTVHPTKTTGCKMKDGREWILGNSGNSMIWNGVCANNAQNKDDPTDSSKTYASCSGCPSGYNFPRITDFDKLVQAYGGTSSRYNRSGYQEKTGVLYKVLGLSRPRYYWSSTEGSSDLAYYLYVGSSSSYTTYNSNKTGSAYVLCYK